MAASRFLFAATSRVLGGLVRAALGDVAADLADHVRLGVGDRAAEVDRGRVLLLQLAADGAVDARRAADDQGAGRGPVAHRVEQLGGQGGGGVHGRVKAAGAAAAGAEEVGG